jgi:small GTP-binding protein
MSEQMTFPSILSDLALLVGKLENKTVTLSNGAQLIPGLGMTETAETIRKYINVLNQNVTNILILGQFNVGKTTLLNALMGARRLPTGPLPKTAVITRVVYGENQGISVIEQSGRTRQITWEEFEKEFQLTLKDTDAPENINRFKNIEYVDIELQHPLLKKGISFVDTPGLGEHFMRTRVTLKYLRQTQAVIFVLDAAKLFSREERSLIKMLGSLNLDHLFFVVNRINQVDKEEISEVQKWVKNGLSKYFSDEYERLDQSLYDSRLFFLDAHGAMQARQQQPVDQKALEKSKLPEFESQLNFFLQSEQRHRAAQRAIARNLIFMAAAARERIRFFRTALTQPIDKAQQMAQAAEARLKMLEEEMKKLRSLLEDMTDKIKYTVYADMLRYVSEMQSTWEEDSIHIIELDPSLLLRMFKSKEGHEKFKEYFEAEIQKYLEIKFAQWSDRVLLQLGPEVEDLINKFENRVQAFSIGLAEAETLFSGRSNAIGSSTEVLTQRVLERLKTNDSLYGPFNTDMIENVRTVAASAVVLIVGALVMSRWFLIALGSITNLLYLYKSLINENKSDNKKIVPDFVDPIRNKISEKFRSHLFTEVKTKLFDDLRKEISSKQDELYTQMDSDFSKLIDKLMEDLQTQINRVREEIDRLKNYMVNQGETTEDELHRLEVVDEEIMHALNSLLQESHQKTVTGEELDEAAKSLTLTDLIPETKVEKPLRGIIPEPPMPPKEEKKESKLVSEQRKQIAKIISERTMAAIGLPIKPDSSQLNREVSKLSPELSGLIGLEEVKKRVLELMYFIKEEHRRFGKDYVRLPNLHMVFTGNPGTGKTTVARYIGKIYRQIGLLKKGDVHEVNINDLTSRYVGNTTKEAEKHFEKALDGVIFIDEAYQLVSDGISYRGEVVDMIIHYAETYRNRLAIILAGYPEEMTKFLDYNPGLRRRFPMENVIEFPDYQPAELYAIFQKMLTEVKLAISESAQSQLEKVIEGMYALRKPGFGNAGEMRNLLDALRRCRASRVQRSGLPQTAPIEPEDIPPKYEGYILTSAAQPEEILKELNDFIGMKELKEQLRLWVGQLKYQQRYGKSAQKAPLMHMVFSGNPGTGKTSVAHVMVRIFKSLGFLRKETMEEVSSSKLVAKYLGHSGPQTKKIIEEALDGILFIDEAYSLYTGRLDEEHGDFGAEVIKELVLAMENYRDRLVVILAGYPEKMNRLLDSNEGLRSRIPFKFTFPDYASDELMQIFLLQMQKERLTLTVEAEVKVKSTIQAMYNDRSSTFGNGRDVENLLTKIKERQNARAANLPDSPDLDKLKDQIEPEDVPDYTPEHPIPKRVGDKVNYSHKSTDESFSPETKERLGEIRYIAHPATDRSR